MTGGEGRDINHRESIYCGHMHISTCCGENSPGRPRRRRHGANNHGRKTHRREEWSAAWQVGESAPMVACTLAREHELG